ncbi:MAG: class I SAM-dependent methyltransferase [Erysipelotrichaceae bacterium]|nr:class I SAM-dependent methyltransferase [Erysipelotrichaceae bacterium]MDD3810044.1 class I SAM-dependent methyltransferase [Erysipelotrichaceae bacterium]
MKTIVDYIGREIASLEVAVAVDFTMGNGFDTMKLAKMSQKVYSFDIQPLALERTRTLLEQHDIPADRVELILDDHRHFGAYLDRFDLGVFNLGYLPNGDHHITTTKTNTIATLERALKALETGGIILIGVYVGHDGGVEGDAIRAFCSELDNDFNVSCYQMLNKQKAPYVIVIEKAK